MTTDETFSFNIFSPILKISLATLAFFCTWSSAGLVDVKFARMALAYSRAN
jgi:hypothetical protein